MVHSKKQTRKIGSKSLCYLTLLALVGCNRSYNQSKDREGHHQTGKELNNPIQKRGRKRSREKCNELQAEKDLRAEKDLQAEKDLRKEWQKRLPKITEEFNKKLQSIESKNFNKISSMAEEEWYGNRLPKLQRTFFAEAFSSRDAIWLNNELPKSQGEFFKLGIHRLIEAWLQEEQRLYVAFTNEQYSILQLKWLEEEKRLHEQFITSCNIPTCLKIVTQKMREKYLQEARERLSQQNREAQSSENPNNQ